MRVGLRSLAEVPGERWFVMGEMAELGEESPRLHAEIGALARQCGVTKLFAVGQGSLPAVEAYGDGATWHASVEDVVTALLPQLRAGLTVYVKGSRINRLERVTVALAGGTRAAGEH
jgi:UDP-N-acetylmuramoyl-tripeptide--D-alanyl-D-alanine ligase